MVVAVVRVQAWMSGWLHPRQLVDAVCVYGLEILRRCIADALDGIPDFGPACQRRQRVNHAEDAVISEDDLFVDLGIPIECPTDRFSRRELEAEPPHRPESTT